jgi:ABC-type transporter Mla subunit MlaD
MRHVQLRPVPVPVSVGTISAPLSRVVAFFDMHALGLSRLVEAIGREDLGQALDEAIAAVSGAAPNAEAAADAVSTLRDALAEVPVAAVDAVATTTSGVWDPYTALLWYGARLSDLTAGLRSAGGGTTT